ncbi:MAG: S1C family serine protease [Planctomycetaceae bacterium]
MAGRDEVRPPVPSASGSVNGWLVGILLIVVAAMYFQYIGLIPGPLLNPNAAPRLVTPRGDLAGDEKAQIELFQQASPSVAHVTSLTTVLQRRGVSTNPLDVPLGTGSGFLWDEDGHIVTNYHVVRGATRIFVTLGTSTQLEARFVGSEPEKDLAVLKIDAPRGTLRPLIIGTSADLMVGQKVFAIGNPFGLDQTLTTGIISGLGREIDPSSDQGPRGQPSRGLSRKIQDVIQIDAAINPGNSGGPLLDSAGRVIGINTAIISPSGAYAGVGFAVPIDTINVVVPQIIRTGRAERPALGITLVSDAVVNRLRDLNLIEGNGALVDELVPGGAAEAAGIQPSQRTREGRVIVGDFIKAINGQPVEDTPSLLKIIDRHKVGETVEVTVQRNGAEKKLSVVLQQRPDIVE